MRYEVTSDAAKALNRLWDELGPGPLFRGEKPDIWDEAAVAGLLASLCGQWKEVAADGENYWRDLHSEDEHAIAVEGNNKTRRIEHAQIEGCKKILEREGLYSLPVKQAIETALQRVATVRSVIFEDKPKLIKPAARNAFEQDTARVLFALGWNIKDAADEIERLLREFDFRNLNPSRTPRTQLPDSPSIAARIRLLHKK